jgi:hypothetical protein
MPDGWQPEQGCDIFSRYRNTGIKIIEIGWENKYRGEFAFGEPFGVHHTIKNNYIMMKTKKVELDVDFIGGQTSLTNLVICNL